MFDGVVGVVLTGTVVVSVGGMTVGVVGAIGVVGGVVVEVVVPPVEAVDVEVEFDTMVQGAPEPKAPLLVAGS